MYIGLYKFNLENDLSALATESGKVNTIHITINKFRTISVKEFEAIYCKIHNAVNDLLASILRKMLISEFIISWITSDSFLIDSISAVPIFF